MLMYSSKLKQISSHSETGQVRRASSSSRKSNGKKTREVCTTELSVVACLPCNYYFYGFLFNRVFVFVKTGSEILGLRFRNTRSKGGAWENTCCGQPHW